eukprot:s1613_g21.t1
MEPGPMPAQSKAAGLAQILNEPVDLGKTEPPATETGRPEGVADSAAVDGREAGATGDGEDLPSFEGGSLFRGPEELENYLEELVNRGAPELQGEEFYDPGVEEEFEQHSAQQTLADHFETMNQASLDRIFFENSMMSVGAGMPKLPWEEGVFAQIFGSADALGFPGENDFTPMPAFPVFPGPEVAGDSFGQPVIGATRELPLFAKHVRALCDADYNQSLDLKWTRALACWLTILESSGFDSLVGSHVMEKLSERDRDGALTYVRDACGVRSPNTVLKRARDLQPFINWCVDNGRMWWPMMERNLLDFLSACEAGGRSKFIGKNLVHAVKFFKYVMGANFVLEEVTGPLLQGRVLRALSTRDPTQQARALTVEEVRALEDMVANASNVLDKYFAGCMLFALYSRARWSDLASMQSLFYDVVDTHEGPFGFIEARTRIHKTSNSAEKKAMYLPFVAPTQGVGERYWALDWKETLEKLELLHDREPYGPVCRAPTSVGGFTKRPLASDEISSILNDFLKLTDTEQAASSHSLKATTLVWAARYGIDDTSRAMLGHHAIQNKSMACYSRDLLAKPLRELCGMLLNVRLGHFRPDGTRSGYMRDSQVNLLEKEEAAAVDSESVVPSPSIVGAEEPQGAAKDADVSGTKGLDPSNPFQETEQTEDGPELDPENVIDGEDLLESASSDSEESKCDTEVNEECFHKKFNSVLNSGVEPSIEGPLMQNKRSRMIHRKCSDPNNKLQPITDCGLRGSGFVVLENGAAFDWPKCSKCFKVQSAPSGLATSYSANKRKRQL